MSGLFGGGSSKNKGSHWTTTPAPVAGEAGVTPVVRNTATPESTRTGAPSTIAAAPATATTPIAPANDPNLVAMDQRRRAAGMTKRTLLTEEFDMGGAPSNGRGSYG